jgi:molecular chaperone DnaK (HSP70)
MNAEHVGEIFAIILVSFVGLLLGLSFLAAHKKKGGDLSAEAAQLQALTDWLVHRIRFDNNRPDLLDKMAMNRVRGAAVKAFYHLKRNQTVTIQLPQLFMGDKGLEDFQISISREQLQQICFGLHSQ